MKRIIILFSLILCQLSVLGQQDAMYSQYLFNKLAINPAYAGSRGISSASALFRTQWVGIKGAPVTKTVSYDGPLRNNKIGLGIQAFNYQMGITNLNGAFVSYSYRINFSASTLAFGLQGGASHIKADLNSVKLGTQGQDQAFSQNINEVFLNFGTGAYYNTEKFYVGFSVPHLLRNRLRTDYDESSDGLVSRQHLNIFLTSGYEFRLGEDFKLTPSFLLRGMQGSPARLDLNANMWIKDRFSVGLQYRISEAIGAILEVNITPQISMGYSYDRSITKLIEFNSGSHEIMLAYKFKLKKESKQ